MKNYFLFILVLILSLSCKKDAISTLKNNYYLNINASVEDGKKVYIQNLNDLTKVDSSTIKNSTTIFTGHQDFPERYVLTIESLFGGKLFILENDTINITISNNDLINAKIKKSKINDELINFQKKSEQIYNQIDLLFPDLQRARLENNASKLKEISEKMSQIEEENINYNFEYASQNPSSYISAMILHDLSKRDSIDKIKISQIYNHLSEKVKRNSDAVAVHNFIQHLH